MPPFGLVACAIAAVLGTLAASPLPPDVRAIVTAGVVGAGVFNMARPRRSAAFRTAVVAVLVASYANDYCLIISFFNDCLKWICFEASAAFNT